MTRVIGATSVYGYGALYSDVEVTFADGVSRDLVQKAYPITNFIAAGFSGSVRVGFALLQSLANCTKLPTEALTSQAWDPVWVATKWAPVARSVFEGAPPEEQQAGASLLLLGASPTKDAGLGAKMFLVRFAAPDFEPGIMARFIMSCSIGSGAGDREYKQSIKPQIRFINGIHRAEVMNRNGWAQELAFCISRAVADRPRTGISRHFHGIVVRRGEVSTWNNNERIYHPDGTVVEVRMPHVAQGYEEFRRMAAGAGSECTCATC